VRAAQKSRCLVRQAGSRGAKAAPGIHRTRAANLSSRAALARMLHPAGVPAPGTCHKRAGHVGSVAATLGSCSALHKCTALGNCTALVLIVDGAGTAPRWLKGERLLSCRSLARGRRGARGCYCVCPVLLAASGPVVLERRARSVRAGSSRAGAGGGPSMDERVLLASRAGARSPRACGFACSRRAWSSALAADCSRAAPILVSASTRRLSPWIAAPVPPPLRP
jgi:hypothetical protein